MNTAPDEKPRGRCQVLGLSAQGAWPKPGDETKKSHRGLCVEGTVCGGEVSCAVPELFRKASGGLPWRPVIEIPPASAGDAGSIPGLGSFCMPGSSY